VGTCGGPEAAPSREVEGGSQNHGDTQRPRSCPMPRGGSPGLGTRGHARLVFYLELVCRGIRSAGY
jgi:hypothetical protein